MKFKVENTGLSIINDDQIKFLNSDLIVIQNNNIESACRISTNKFPWVNNNFFGNFFKNITPKYIAISFQNSFYNNFEKIRQSFDIKEILKDNIKPSILIFNDKNKNFITSYIKSAVNSEYAIVGVYTFLGKTFLGSLSFQYHFNDKKTVEIKCLAHEVYQSNTYDAILGHPLLLSWFINYCDIDVKILSGGKKIKDIKCKYFNDTNQSIEIIDSTWFTTLIKSDEFKVRGHFRFQRYGERLSLKKIIWIADFKKHGYTRNFKKHL